MKSSERYSQLSQSEDNMAAPVNLENGLLQFQNYDLTRKLILILIGILGAVACFTVGYIAHPNPQSPSTEFNTSANTTLELQCGNSSVDALANGCIFDLLTNNWMPKHCSDPYTDDEYRAWVLSPNRQLGAWAFFYDDQAEMRVESEEELSGLVGKHVYTTTENHLAHCAFLARRMHRLVTGEIAAVAHNTFAHTMHCTSSILKAIQEPAVSQIGSTFDVGIVSCLVG